MRLQDAIDFWARREPDRPAIAIGNTAVLSYAALQQNIHGLAHSLVAGNAGDKLKPGSRVVLLINNSPEFFECLFACWLAGLTPVPLNTRLHPRELRYIVKHSGASMVFASESLVSRFIEAGCPIHSVDSAEYRRLKFLSKESQQAQLPATGMPASTDTTRIAWLFYTSGTTGQPKGAMLSFANLEAMCRCYFRDVDPDFPWSSILHPAPLSHGSGLYSLPHFMKGSCQVIPESGGFEAEEVFELINAWQDSVFFAAPTMIRRLTVCNNDVDETRLKSIFFGGAPMHFEDIRNYIERFGPRLSQIYGQGESPMTITAYTKSVVADTSHPRWKERVHSAGTAQSAVSVKCVDESGREVPDGAPGEVIVSGETVMRGYWEDEEATKSALRNGWLWTGDIGSLDEEGFLTLMDRSKDLVISGGSNIYPREIEEVLLTHENVQEVSVIGAPDREWGEVVVAYVVTAQGGNKTSNNTADTIDQEKHALMEQELDALCLNALARYKRPKIYRYIDELPKNNYGKILKTRLRELEREQDQAGES